MYKDEILKWASDYNFESRSKDTFWLYIENYKNEDIISFIKDFKGIDFSKIKLTLEKISINLNFMFEPQYEYFAVKLEVSCDEDIIGHYEVVFNLEGEIKDATFFSF